MGAIVGAAYATGMRAKELERVISAINWQETLTSAPRQDVPYHRKALDFIFTLGFEVGLKDGELVGPGGLVPTHQVENLFRQIVPGARQVTDFDRLPIPFRAVATDLESGEMVVFGRGDLTIAMRASMAVPGAFAPVAHENRLLVDGMLVRNLPIDVARKMCADVIIAVPVAIPPATRADLRSALEVAGQAMNIAIEANEKAQLATLGARDITIPVVLPGIASGDFHKVPEAIPIGEAAARKALSALSKYALGPREYAAWRGGLGDIAKAPAIRIDEIRMTGFKDTNPDAARTFITARPGDAYDPVKADADATRLVARGDYSNVSHQVTTEDGKTVLTYSVTEKGWGPNYLLFDINLSTDLKSDTAWGLRFDYERRWLNSLGGELRTSLQVGRPNVFNAEFYQPLDLQQRFFIAPSIYASQSLLYLYTGDTTVAQYDVRRFGVRLDGGIALDTWGEFRLGLQRGGLDASPKVGSVVIPNQGHESTAGVTTRFNYDTYDRRAFPTHGSLGRVTGYFSETGLGAEQSYRTIEASWSTVHTLGRNVFTLGARGGTSLGSEVPIYDQFRLGGLFNFSGYRNQQLTGREYALGTIQYRRRVADISETLGSAVYAGGTLELGNVYQRADGTNARGVLTSGSLFLGISSKIGPVYLAYGHSEGGRSAYYIYIGSSLEAYRP